MRLDDDENIVLPEDRALLAEIRHRAHSERENMRDRAQQAAGPRQGRNIACDGKQRYWEPEFAHSTATRLGSRFGTPLWPYKCPYCDAWHLATDTTRPAA